VKKPAEATAATTRAVEIRGSPSSLRLRSSADEVRWRWSTATRRILLAREGMGRRFSCADGGRTSSGRLPKAARLPDNASRHRSVPPGARSKREQRIRFDIAGLLLSFKPAPGLPRGMLCILIG
jgi:hypothetical protein